MDILSRLDEVPLTEQATMEEAIDLYLADACSLGRAAELAGVTRWDLADQLKMRGIPIVVHNTRSAQEIDELAETLELGRTRGNPAVITLSRYLVES